MCDARVVARAMAGADVVVNFAAETAVDRSIDDPLTFLRTDVEGVHTLLQRVGNSAAPARAESPGRTHSPRSMRMPFFLHHQPLFCAIL